ncbi:hypothetical protein MTR_5g029740 [Medicago truncatula]|uniref:Uncharacterized protein n=1 Tax=Medicago truncatula TaxID=3880 RepID=G7KDP0_MEDTR|nr:hypothetical protein MTR_5g029740 [Medicago truncatula]
MLVLSRVEYVLLEIANYLLKNICNILDPSIRHMQRPDGVPHTLLLHIEVKIPSASVTFFELPCPKPLKMLGIFGLQQRPEVDKCFTLLQTPSSTKSGGPSPSNLTLISSTKRQILRS